MINFTGDVAIEEITPRDVKAWQSRLLEQGSSPVTVNTVLRGLKTVYSRLQRSGFTGVNPAKPVPFLEEPNHGPRAISRANYQRMVAAASTDRDKAILNVLWSTGCRRGGLFSMNVNQIDSWYGEQGQCYAIPVIEKGNRQRYVYIKGAATYYLSRWLKLRPPSSSKALFLSHSNERLTRTALSSLMWRLEQEARIPAHEPASAHSFRHAFAIRKLDEGYDLALVSQWLGHSNPEFTAKVYCVRSEHQLRTRFFKRPQRPTFSLAQSWKFVILGWK